MKCCQEFFAEWGATAKVEQLMKKKQDNLEVV